MTPDLFPARRSGERWGDLAVCLDLPGGPYLFAGLDRRQNRLIHRHFGQWCRPRGAGGAAVETTVFRAAASDFVALDQVGWQVTIDRDYQPQGVRLASYLWMATLDLGHGLEGGLWTPLSPSDETASVFVDLFENYFRILVAYRLLQLGGLLVHSAAAADEPHAFLFPGASGDGKSTLSKLCLGEGRQVLSDDGNALLPAAGGGAELAALPFGGELRSRSLPAGRFPLTALVALAKAAEHRLEPLPRTEAAALLVRSAPFVNGDPHRCDKLMEVVDRLTRAVPTRRLFFVRAGGFWNLLTGTSVAASDAAHAAAELATA